MYGYDPSSVMLLDADALSMCPAGTGAVIGTTGGTDGFFLGGRFCGGFGHAGGLCALRVMTLSLTW